MLPAELIRSAPPEDTIVILDEPALSVPVPASRVPTWERRSVVLGMIAFVGPLGLLLLWFSRRFGNRSKVLITLAYVAATILFPIALIWYFCDYALQPLVRALGK